MKSDELNRFWTEEFGDSLPVADELKWKFSHRWFRIHTLPDSKRYADNECEYDEILRRHNLILEDLFDAKENLILVSCNYSEKSKPTKNPKLEAIGLQENIWRSISLSDEEESDEYYSHLFFDQKIWKIGLLDSLFRLVADEEVNNVMVISAENNFVCHPYDGGADLILNDSETRDEYRQNYKSWFSAHPSGF